MLRLLLLTSALLFSLASIGAQIEEGEAKAPAVSKENGAGLDPSGAKSSPPPAEKAKAPKKPEAVDKAYSNSSQEASKKEKIKKQRREEKASPQAASTKIRKNIKRDTTSSKTKTKKKSSRRKKALSKKKAPIVTQKKTKKEKKPKKSLVKKAGPEQGPALARKELLSIPSGTGFLGQLPNLEKESLPGYRDIVDTWKVNFPHKGDGEEGFFSKKSDEAEEEEFAGDASQREGLSKRTIINLSILVVLTLALLFYRMRAGHFSK